MATVLEKLKNNSGKWRYSYWEIQLYFKRIQKNFKQIESSREIKY